MSNSTQYSVQSSLTLEDYEDPFSSPSSYSWTPDVNSHSSLDLSNTALISRDLEVKQGNVLVTQGDVIVDGRSLKSFMNEVCTKLNILQMNPQLEAEWTALRDLGHQYRALEAQIMEKIAIWQRLKD